MPTRCAWVTDDPLYIAYHDREWGVPVHDDRRHFEFLVLESAQAGLSWLTILHKREGYRRAFAGFDAEAVARFGPPDVERLLADPAIVRNRRKVEAAVANARVFLEIQSKFGSFDAYIWRFVGGSTRRNAWRTAAEVPVSTPESEALSDDLKRQGMRFVGPVVIYAHMQACGLVDDHTTDCFRHGR